jgi:hypothetical protein
MDSTHVNYSTCSRVMLTKKHSTMGFDRRKGRKEENVPFPHMVWISNRMIIFSFTSSDVNDWYRSSIRYVRCMYRYH